MIWCFSHTKSRWNFGSRISPRKILPASSSILSTVGSGALETGAGGDKAAARGDLLIPNHIVGGIARTLMLTLYFPNSLQVRFAILPQRSHQAGWWLVVGAGWRWVARRKSRREG